MITALLVVGILVFLIVVHELGHFIAAKISRVRVEEFGIGYPPRAFTVGRLGGTEYTLNWIPFGGFVRLFGDVGEEQHGAGSLVDANRAVQALILVAGVAMNALAAWALFTAALHAGIPRVVETPAEGEVVRLMIANVVPGSPADSAGITAGDEILGLEDEDVVLMKLTPEAFSDFIRAHPGQAVTLTYLHAGQERTTNITPAHAVVPEAAGRPALGVGVVLVSSRPLSWGDAAVQAVTTTKNSFITVVRVLALAAFISVNLAIINLIPIPALDGGRLVLLGIETIMRRSAPKLTLQMLNALGVALIIVLMITVTYNDIARLLT
ncbi:site-2 protease family protein [Candidatus Kaiserbacteria bacterium]|nr:site-2 protease family protein [Candidatus Kaiserbacteria bacterium]